MILNNPFEVKLEKVIKKVLFLHAAISDTFLMLVMLQAGTDAVIHVNKHGKIIFQHIFPHPMLTMGMLSPREGIFIDTRAHKLLFLDLDTQFFKESNHLFMFEESDQSQIITFPEGRYLCIQEKGRYNRNRYSLTYYCYPIQISSGVARKAARYNSEPGQWTYEYTTRKGNNHSLIIWFKVRHSDNFQFKTYEIIDGKGQYRSYNFSRSIPGQGKIETVITNVWELRPKVYIFVCFCSKPTENDNYVIDINQKGSIRPFGSTFGVYQHQLIDCYNLGKYSMFRTFNTSHGKILESPIFYVENQKQKIVAQEKWICNASYKYEFGSQIGVLCEGQYDNLDVQQFKVTLKKIVAPRPLYESLLRQGSIKFEEDLINEVLQALL